MPALVSVPNLPSGMESFSNKDLLISVNSGDRMMDWEQPESESKETKGFNTPGLFLYKATFSISALKLTHIPLIPALSYLQIKSKRRHKTGREPLWLIYSASHTPVSAPAFLASEPCQPSQ